METLFAPAVNLVILIAALVYYLRKPMRDFVHQRHVFMRDELQEVRERLAAAQAKYDEFNSKLKAMDAEIAALKAQALKDAADAKVRIVREAQRIASQIGIDAKGAAETLFSEFKSQLHVELGGRVLERAEKILRDRLTGDDRTRIRKEFSHQLETMQ